MKLLIMLSPPVPLFVILTVRSFARS